MTDNAETDTNQTWADRVGAVASGLCAVHCALCAFAPIVFGALGLGVLLSHEAEWALTLFAVAFGIGALLLSWRRDGSKLVASLLVLGIVGLLGARFMEMSGHHDHHDEHHHAEGEHAEAGHEGEHDDGHHDGDEHASAGEHGDEHHDEHGDEHHDEHGDGHHDEHGDEHEGDSLHAIGGTLGFAAGLLLFSGHLLNIRTARRRRDDCCD